LEINSQNETREMRIMNVRTLRKEWDSDFFGALGDLGLGGNNL